MMRNFIFCAIGAVSVYALTGCTEKYTIQRDYFIYNQIDTTLTVNFSLEGVDQSVTISKQGKSLIYHQEIESSNRNIPDERETDDVSDVQLRWEDQVHQLDEETWYFGVPRTGHIVYSVAVDSILLGLKTPSE